LFTDSLETTRRRFLKLATGILTLLVSLAVTLPIIGVLIGPVFRSRKPSWIKVADLEAVSSEKPTRLTFPVQTTSAYIRETVLRDVWMIKHPSLGITVFSPICPHLGCEYNWNPQTGHFECPCHGSVYGINGQVLGGPAPRPLDTLPAKVEAGTLYVKWETFKIGVPEKISV
jgi:menaquinol-cytochrome c reductase iron-sulfur subunit